MEQKYVVVKRRHVEEPLRTVKLRKNLRRLLETLNLEGYVDEVVEEVISTIIERGHVGKISWRDLADIIEITLLRKGLEDPKWFEAAKLYVLTRIYKQARGSVKEIDPVDIQLTYQALKLLEFRYLLKDPYSEKVLETPKDMWIRVAKRIASVDSIYGVSRKEISYRIEAYFKLMSSLKFQPNSPTLMNAGTELGQLSACFIIPVPDDLEGIFEALKVMALVQRSGAGTGFDFSRLRPKGDIIERTGGKTSGPVSFMKIFDVATDVIKEGGKRRGANMGLLHVWHPDILEFINSKCNPLSPLLSTFNISVAVYDDFIKAVLNDEEWPLINPRECPEVLEAPRKGINLILEECKRKGVKVKYVKARMIFDNIVECAWRSGDPGIIFIDEVERHNIVPHLGVIHAVNPCGEVPALDWESCNLGSLNLLKYVIVKGDETYIDWDGLARDVRLAVRFLDSVIDVNKFPDERIEKVTKRTRKIGLGVMGLADMLVRLRIPYDSEDALYIADNLMEWIAYHGKLASIELVKEKGCFPEYPKSLLAQGKLNFEPQIPSSRIYSFSKVSSRAKKLVSLRPKTDWSKVRDLQVDIGIRNATITTIAPTGSISIIAGVNSGIEPFFALAYLRETTAGIFVEVNRLLLNDLKAYGLYSKDRILEIAKVGKVRGLKWIPEELQRIYPTAHDIPPLFHVKMQAVFQRWTDNAVSKTVNLPHTATKRDVEEVFMYAWKLKLKGITIYRDLSKPSQVIKLGIDLDKLLRRKPIRMKMDRSLALKYRIKDKELHYAPEDYAGGCPTCNI